MSEKPKPEEFWTVPENSSNNNQEGNGREKITEVASEVDRTANTEPLAPIEDKSPPDRKTVNKVLERIKDL